MYWLVAALQLTGRAQRPGATLALPCVPQSSTLPRAARALPCPRDLSGPRVWAALGSSTNLAGQTTRFTNLTFKAGQALCEIERGFFFFAVGLTQESACPLAPVPLSPSLLLPLSASCGAGRRTSRRRRAKPATLTSSFRTPTRLTPALQNFSCADRATFCHHP